MIMAASKRTEKSANSEKLKKAFPSSDLEVGDRIFIQRLALYGRVVGFTRNDEVRYMPAGTAISPDRVGERKGERICKRAECSFMPSMGEIYGPIRSKIQDTWTDSEENKRAGANGRRDIDVEQTLTRQKGYRKGNQEGNHSS